ncbi:MAG: UDP-N-acetylmuramate--L-alanine ligase [Candidatus Blackburnbacteria bacterium RIFCSPLOWO2_02_FULL_44_9]|nr:MAG: UDP-N-acetylmuramate--L-alanine ligase [Candidatus Blackburnbacteria bacterium RIFCSPLOWO2_02_FULL_44_9]
MTPNSPILEAKHIHFTGIKGVAMTALALCAQDLGIRVTGSDIKEVFVTDATLARRGLAWLTGFHPVNLKDKPDLVIFTGAHGGFNNPEVIAAKEMGIPIMTQAEALGEFTKGKDLITVAGVGGKTTIASMVSTLLDSAGQHPSFAVGVGDIFALNTPGRYDKEGKEFVTEADEYAVAPGTDNRPRFTYQNPKVLIIPNIEHDHPDIYPTFKDSKKVFLEFINRVPKDGLLIACIDNKNVRTLLKQTSVPVKTYGFSPDADYHLLSTNCENEETRFTLKHNGKTEDYTLKVPGKFNVLNATATIICGTFLGLTGSHLVNGIKDYTGCKRRIEKVTEKDGITYYDDYAHHPTEIQAVLSGLRDWYPKRRIIAIFQPHTYSRTKALFEEFAQSFGNANKVAIMDIYSSARETDTLGVTSEKLVQEAKIYHNEVSYTQGHKETLEFLAKILQKDDLVVTLGAGDIFYLHEKL